MPVTPSTTARDALVRFFDVGLRADTYRSLAYLALAFPFGLAYSVFVIVGFVAGVPLSVVLVGIPILAVTVLGTLAAGTLEGVLARTVLGVEISQRPLPRDGSFRERAWRVLSDRGTWTTAIYLPTKLAFGVVALVLGTSVLATGVSMLLVPLYYREPGVYVGLVTDRPVELHPSLYVAWNKLLVGFETVVTLDAWYVTTLEGALVVAVAGAFVLLLGLHAVHALGRLARWYTIRMLDGAYAPLSGGR